MRIVRLGMGVVVRREWMRGEKTAEDQGVPWRRTRVWAGGCDCGDEGVVGEERRAYLISQFAWWKVDGRLRGDRVGEGILFLGGGFVGVMSCEL
jgi:hypothetical protein